MENLAGCGGLHDLHIGVGGQLHEALKTRRAVLGALTFVAVRQHERQAIDAAPLHFTGGNELIDHHLRAVGKVAELRFPDHHGVGVVRCVAVLKAQHRLFGQDGVDNDKRGLVFGDVLQGHVGAGVPLLALLVVNHGVAVRESATARVLPGQTNRVAASDQRSKSHVLTHSPVHGNLTTTHGGSVVINLFHQLMR